MGKLFRLAYIHSKLVSTITYHYNEHLLSIYFLKPNLRQLVAWKFSRLAIFLYARFAINIWIYMNSP